MVTKIEQDAVNLVSAEKTAWETGTAFITEKVAFQMRNLIRKLRKNYWGVFDSPYDPTTGREKIWIPLTESLTEAVVKNTDLDTKDINVRAQNPSVIGLTAIVRSLLRHCLDEIGFGEKLDMLVRDLAIDGTAVWYIGEKKEDGKIYPDIRRVDLLNFYIDPTAASIQEAEAVIERVLVTKDEFDKLAKDNKWVNSALVKGTNVVSRIDGELGASADTRGETRLVTLFRRVGLTPKHIITGKKEDEDKYINAEIICSESNGMIFHSAETLKSSLKPYEEAWYTRAPGRWYGRGIAEKVKDLQLWLNTVVNIRINRHSIAQLGIFKIKKNRGITPQMISRLATNGAILVDEQDDIEQFPMQEASQSSYTDEQVIQSWAERNTAAYEVVTGESLPSSTTATAIAVQGRNAQSQFGLIKEGIGMFLQRVMNDHVLPTILSNVSVGELVRITGSQEELKEIDAYVVNNMASEQISQIQARGGFVDPQQVMLAIQSGMEKLARAGDMRYAPILKKLEPEEYDVKVYVTNEEFDPGVMTQNLITMLQAAPEMRNAIIPQVFDLMGLTAPKMQEMPTMGGVPNAIPPAGHMGDLSARSNTRASAPTA